MDHLLLAANTADSKVTKGRAGRKQKDIVPVDEKHKKNLEAQRAFRERRSNHIASLEKEVAELKAVIDGRVPLGNDTELELLRQQLLAVTTENSLMKQSSISIDFRSTVPSSASAMVAGIDCVGCSVEKLKTLLCMGQIKSLESKVTELTHENQALKSILASFQAPFLQSFVGGLSMNSSMDVDIAGSNGSPSDFGQEWNDLINGAGSGSIGSGSVQTGGPSTTETPPASTAASATPQIQQQQQPLHQIPDTSPMSATELYGPPETEFARIACNSIPSIKGNKLIDELFDIFTVVSSCCDIHRIRKHMIRMLRIRGKLLDQCAVMDRQKVIEIFVMFLERNKRHTEYRNSLLATLPTPTDEDVDLAAAMANFVDTADSKRFRDSLLAIPPLKDDEPIIKRLCVLLWTPTPPGKGNGVFNRIVKTKKVLEAKLEALEDKTKFSMAMEIQRYSRDSNKTALHSLLVEITSDGEED
ncbi:UNVERIFIED_CONTAM: hypothetical protein HDU68_003976 [Siphonaria sp. JEL0065]|nr:hypothetical protein HDU68_003976 [Siphonaria sp. JEL0065]